MRVIAGSAKGTRLRPVPSSGTRPISDRVKAALFDILGERVLEARILDLFAGTGSVGVEALSRGAREAVFVERHAKAVATIRSNLDAAKLSDRGRVVMGDVFDFLLRPPSAFDVIHIAPPQYLGLWKKAVLRVDVRPAWLKPEGVAVVQVFPKEWEPLPLVNLRVGDQRRYGSTLLAFYGLAPSGSAQPIGGSPVSQLE